MLKLMGRLVKALINKSSEPKVPMPAPRQELVHDTFDATKLHTFAKRKGLEKPMHQMFDFLHHHPAPTRMPKVKFAGQVTVHHVEYDPLKMVRITSTSRDHNPSFHLDNYSTVIKIKKVRPTITPRPTVWLR